MLHNNASRRLPTSLTIRQAQRVNLDVRKLEMLLKKAGWKVNYVAIPLGTTGSIHNTFTKTLRQTLKLEGAKIDRTCNRLHELSSFAY